MSQSQDPDPGGSQDSTRREISDLKDQNEQQLVLIAQLKEMLRKSDQQTKVTDDKVQEYIKTLNRKKKNKSKKDDGSEASTVNIDSNKKERLNLLRQQMEENKAKLAERGKSQKGLEEMVSQLTVQFNDSQQLISQTPLNLSLQETKTLDYNKNSSQEELYNILLTKEKKITELTSKIQKLEGSVIDLQENLKEKDSVLDARTKAITLMTESLSKKGKNTLDELEETKEQMRKMQENFITLEQEMKTRQLKLLDDLKLKNSEILDLQEMNANLEKEKEQLKLELEENVKMLEEFRQKEMSPTQSETPSPSKGKKKNKKGKQQKKADDPSSEEPDLQSEITRLIAELDELKNANEILLEKNNGLVDENNNLVATHKTLVDANEELTKKVKQLEEESTKTLEELNQIKDSIREKIVSDATPVDDEEVTKLKKQIDENNKQMIKIKAQHKNKIKDLTKKLDTFKKMSDANAMILQLQNENSKLEQKIAELEDEKGNLQLKMMESVESIKDESVDNKIKEKDDVIVTLENEITNLRAEIEGLNEKINNFNAVQTEKVQSEITNIQIEEKLDIIEDEKKLLINEKHNLEKENQDLQEKLDNIIKEKTELNTKLENYIQENMELIDKLEKLSAEKVSSAESIEIVEGLTQQEKLDFAAYQQNLEATDDLKWNKDNMESSDLPIDQGEGHEELNETVSQLNEDSAELLRKIEMFNVERKEVMAKLDSLREENEKLHLQVGEIEMLREANSQLSMKLKEVENNRDVLEETYEQLQTEKEKLERQVQEIGESQKPSTSDNDIELQLTELQQQCEKLLEENNNLKKSLKESGESVFEKDVELVERLQSAQSETDKFHLTIQEYMETIDNYKSIIEDNKQELISSSKIINDLQQKLNEREKGISEDKLEIESLNSTISNLNTALTNLEELHKNQNQEHDEKVQDKMRLLEEELDDLKTTLNQQIEQAQEYEKELSECHEIITGLNSELKESNIRLNQCKETLKLKEDEINKLSEDFNEQEAFIKDLEKSIKEKTHEISGKDSTIANLQQSIAEKDVKFKDLTTELTEKFLRLQEQFDANNGTVEIRIAELQNKNKDLTEKLKKYAANLKKKNQELKELQSVNPTELQNKITQLMQEKSELESNNVQLQNTILHLKEEKANEKENVLSLQQEFSNVHEVSDNAENSDVAKDAKIKELEMIIETKENELSEKQARIDRLEEAISHLEERRMSLERTNVALGDKLTETNASFEEKSLEEEQLEQKLANLLQKDEALSQKLENIILENEELTIKNQEVLEENDKLTVRIIEVEKELAQRVSSQNAYQELEIANQEYVKQITTLENQIRNVQQENDMLKQQSKIESEKYENETQMQMDKINEITVKNEKLEEEFQILLDRNTELQSVVEDQKSKLDENTDLLDKINDLNNLLEKAQGENTELKNREKELNEQISSLKVDLIKDIASEAVDEIISEAKSQASSKETTPLHNVSTSETNVPTFTWGDSSNQEGSDWFTTIQPNEIAQSQETNIGNQTESADWFTNVQPNETVQSQEHSQTNTENLENNSTEELLKKIKTLEFMLYSVEKEKDNALLQCHELSNELTRLIYEREAQQPTTQIAPSVIEAQIIPQAVHQQQNIQDLPNLGGLESQIVSEVDIVDSTKDQSLRAVEFEPTRAHEVVTQGTPVVEEGFSKKEAYKCFKTGEDEATPEDGLASGLDPQAAVPIESFVDDNDDGWGWGSDEAKKEEAYLLKASQPEANLKTQVELLSEQLRVFQLEREKHLEEIKQLQIKSGKLIKKCKEFKVKYEQVCQSKKDSASTSKEDDFFNLDNTIQEELKSQITQLEKNLREISNELEKEKLEKSSILKKVDTLTAANEKLIEMKEKQDIELVNVQRQCQEAVHKLEKYEWENDGFTTDASPKTTSESAEPKSQEAERKYEESRQQVEEIKESLRDLMLDNEELQALLEEQRNLRIEAENKLKNLSVSRENVKSEEEFLEVVAQKSQLENEIKRLKESSVSLVQYKALEASLKESQESSTREDEYSLLLKQNSDLEQQLEFLKETSKPLEEYNRLINERNELQENANNLRAEIGEVMRRYEEEMQLKTDLQTRFMHIEANYENLTRELVELRSRADVASEELHQQSTLSSTIAIMEQEKADLEERIRYMEELNEKLQKDYNNLQERTVEDADAVLDLKKKLDDMDQSNRELQAQNHSLNQQIQNLELALSQNKPTTMLQSAASFFDAPKTDQSEVMALKNEIADLNEKLNALDNENKSLIERLGNQTTNEHLSFGNASSFFENSAPPSANLELQNEIIILNEKLQKLESENARLNATVQQHKSSESSLFGSAASFFDNPSQPDSAKLQNEIHQLTENLRILENEKKALYDQLNQQKTVSASSFFEDVNTIDNSQINKLQDEVANYVEVVEKLKRENSELASSLKQSAEPDVSEIESLRTENEALKSKVDNLNSLIEQQTLELTGLKENAEHSQKSYQLNLETTVEELNKKWEEECISRGDVIAETWKLHLETVENDFNNLKNQLELEISELGERCNTLANENNELRKNVDLEIRNEVDKISALEQQIKNTTAALQQKDVELQQVQNSVVMLQAEVDQYKLEVQEKDKKLESINVVIETTMKQFEEKREVVEEVVKILERNVNWVLSFEKDDIIKEIQNQLAGNSNKDSELAALQQKLHDLEVATFATNAALETKSQELQVSLANIESYKLKLEEYDNTYATMYSNLEEKNRQVTDLTEKLRLLESTNNDNNKDVHKLEQELSQCKGDCTLMQSSLAETQNSLFTTVQSYQEKCTAFDKLTEDYTLLQQQYQDKQAEYNNLQIIYEEKCKEFNFVNEKQNTDFNSSMQVEETYKSKMRELENYYENLLLEKQNDFESIKSLNASITTELETIKADNQNLQSQALTELTNQLDNLQQQLAQKNLEIQQIHNEYSIKFAEHSNVNEQVNERAQYCQQLEMRTAELEHHVGELNAMIQGQQDKIAEQASVIQQNNTQIEDLKKIVEGQVIKIEELKNELYQKSNEFDTIIAEMDINRSQSSAITKQPASGSGDSPKSERSDDPSDPVSRAELDLALYMLHQRDVRCEELTVELTQLLEERDTLQLRLSSAIREKEDLRRRKAAGEDVGVMAGASMSPSKSSAIFMAASGIEVGTEPLEEEGGQNLATKLSELKSVGYKKDKTFVDEQESRRLQQLAIMQEHIHEASKLPPEAAQKLVDASYTLSRDVQSPSKVLLNWLWGRSTPKVNDT